MIRLAGALIALAVPTSWIITGEANDYAYQVEGVGRVAIDGVCSVNPSGVDCWRPDGASDPRLTADVDAQLQVNGADSLRLKFRSRNLLLVSEVPSNPNGFGSFRLPPTAVGPGELLPPQGLQQRGRTVYYLDWLQVPNELDRIDLTLMMPIRLPNARLAPKAGAIAKVGDGTVTFSAPKRIPGQESNPPSLHLAWTMDYVLANVPSEAKVMLHPFAVSKDGKRLDFDPRSIEPPAVPNSRHFGIAEATADVADTAHLMFFCNPREIPFIELHPSYIRQILFPNIFLHPKS